MLKWETLLFFETDTDRSHHFWADRHNYKSLGVSPIVMSQGGAQSQNEPPSHSVPLWSPALSHEESIGFGELMGVIHHSSDRVCPALNQWLHTHSSVAKNLRRDHCCSAQEVRYLLVRSSLIDQDLVSSTLTSTRSGQPKTQVTGGATGMTVFPRSSPVFSDVQPCSGAGWANSKRGFCLPFIHGGSGVESWLFPGGSCVHVGVRSPLSRWGLCL